MAWKYFNFECQKCTHVYRCMVDGSDGAPDPCPECGALETTKTLSVPHQIKTYIPDYPGANYHRAGYAAELRRPAEKAGRQVAMPAGASGIFKR